MSGPLAARVSVILRAEEGLRLKVYDDDTGKPVGAGDRLVGHPTVGIGRCLSKKGITAAEAEYLLANDVAECEGELRRRLPWFGRLTPVRMAVLVCMAFQMGVPGLLGFRGTLASVEAGQYERAAEGMLASLWARQTPGRAKRMADLMKEG